MSQMNPSQARVVDPVLTTVARGYRNAAMVAQALFPVVNVPLRAGNIITFGKEDFMLYNTQRAPGEDTRRVKFGYAGSPYALIDYSLEGQVPIELIQEAQNGPGIDLAAGAIRKVQNIMALRLEKQAADLARNASNYASSNKTALSGTSKWSDFTGTSHPIKDVEAAKEAVRQAIGVRPNTLVLGAQVFAQVKQHPDVIDRIKYTGRDVATVELLASLFDIQRVVVGDAIYANDAGTFADVWGKDVVLGYTDVSAMAEMGTPTYGYTYQLNGYPLAEQPYYENDCKSWIYPVSRAEAPVIAGALAGFLIQGAVA